MEKHTESKNLIALGNLVANATTFYALKMAEALPEDDVEHYYTGTFVAIMMLAFDNKPNDFIQWVNQYQFYNKEDRVFRNTLCSFVEVHNKLCPDLQIHNVEIDYPSNS